MKTELISIIVPAYNVEKYIQKTIESLVNQTYENIEIICVDDASTDNTFRLLQSIEKTDGRIKCFHKENEGVTKARKFGFEQATGAYIGFVDADDLVEPTMYERLYENLKKADADISHCGHEVIWTNGKREFFYNTGRFQKQGKTEAIQSLLSGSFEPGLCNKLYKRDLLQDLFDRGVMDYSIKINEDLLMNYYLFKSADTSVFEDVCLYHYLKREGSASSSKIHSKFIWDQINVKKIILEDAKGTRYETSARKALLITCLTRYQVFLKTNNKEFNEDLKQIESLLKEHRQDFGLLNLKHRAGAKAILCCPNLYRKFAAKFL